MRRPVLLAALAGAAVLVPAAPAGAHALLERATPAQGTAVAQAPGEVRLRFSEPVVAVPGSVEVLGPDRRRADRGDGGRDPRDVRVLRASLRPGLPDGVYVVRWKAISADTHPVQGLVPFAVGSGTAEPVALPAWVVAASGDGPPDGLAGGRALGYAGSLGLAALALGWTLLVVPAARAAGRPAPEVPGVLHALALAALLLFGVGAAWSLDAQAATAGSLGAALGSPFGTWWAVRLGLVLAAALLVLAAPAAWTWPVRAAAVAGVAALAAWVPAGHVLAAEGPGPRWVTGAAVAVHLATGALWLGVLVALAALLPAAARAVGAPAGALWARAAPRASVLGLWSFLALAVTGTWASVVHLAAPASLLDSAYGNLLAVKLGVVTLALVVASWQRFVALLELRRAGAGAGWAGRFAGVSAIEASAVLAATVVAGLLATETPA